MGLFDGLTRGSGPEDDDAREQTYNHRIVATNPDGTRHEHPDELGEGAWVFEGDPPTKEQFKFEYGEHLEPGVEYVCCPAINGRPDFDNIVWTLEVESRGPADEEDRLRRVIRDEVGDGQAPPPVEPENIEEALIWRTAVNEGDQTALDELKDLKEREHGDRPNFLQEASLNDNQQILAATFLSMMENYDSIGEAVNDIFAGAFQRPDGTPRVGPMAEPGREAAEQQQPQQEAGPEAETEPETEPEPSPAKAVYEEAKQEAEGEEPERRLDLGDDTGAETREEMAEEVEELAEEPPADRAETAQSDAEPVEAEADPGGMSAAPVGPEPPEDDDETVTEGEVVEDSTVPAEPAVVEKAASDGGEAEIEQCQHVKDDGERCGNPAGDDGYCHVESHGPDEPADPEEVEA